MLTGDVPFDGETDYEIKDSHIRKAVIPPIEKNPSISMEMNNIVLKALAKNPDERFDGCIDFLNYVKALKDETTEESDIRIQSEKTLTTSENTIDRIVENENDHNLTIKSNNTKELIIVLLWGVIGFICTCLSAFFFDKYNINYFYKDWYRDASGYITGASIMMLIGAVLYIKRVKPNLLSWTRYCDIKLLYHLLFFMFNMFVFVNLFCALGLWFFFPPDWYANIAAILIWCYPVFSNKRFWYWIEKIFYKTLDIIFYQ